MSKLKIGYFADGPWSHLALEKLVADNSISLEFICTRYDSPDLFLMSRAESIGIKSLANSNINSDEFYKFLKSFNCDLLVSMSFNQIFKKRVIDLPKRGVINCHAGKLPYYRGRNVLNWALINDEKEFGITVHYIDEGIDTGDIISQVVLPINDNDDYSTLLEKSYLGCSDILYKSIKDIQFGRASRVRQDTIHPVGLYCIARQADDERLIWNQSSRDIFNFVRALCRPGPEARTYYRDYELKINKVKLIENAPAYKGIIGSVLAVYPDGFFVKTMDSFVKVVDWTGVDRIPVGSRLI